MTHLPELKKKNGTDGDHCDLDVVAAVRGYVSTETGKQLLGKLTNSSSRISGITGPSSLLSLKNTVIMYLKGKTQGLGDRWMVS